MSGFGEPHLCMPRPLVWARARFDFEFNVSEEVFHPDGRFEYRWTLARRGGRPGWVTVRLSTPLGKPGEAGRPAVIAEAFWHDQDQDFSERWPVSTWEEMCNAVERINALTGRPGRLKRWLKAD